MLKAGERKAKLIHMKLAGWLLLIVLLLALIFQRDLGAQQTLGDITLMDVFPRIVTPNNDLANDKIFFRFDTDLTGVPLETSVFDIHGAKVAGLELDNNSLYLTWDGKDIDGRNLSAGIYIYSIKIGKNLATGTVVVAK